MKLARTHRQFLERSTEIITVGPDTREAMETFYTRERIRFAGIPDPDHAIADTYAQASAWWKLGRMPAQFVIERGSGIIRFAEYGRSMRDITGTDTLLAVAGALPSFTRRTTQL